MQNHFEVYINNLKFIHGAVDYSSFSLSVYGNRSVIDSQQLSHRRTYSIYGEQNKRLKKRTWFAIVDNHISFHTTTIPSQMSNNLFCHQTDI